MTIRYPRSVALGFSLVLASCGGEGLTLPPEGAAANIEVLAEGNEQNGRVDQTLAKPLVVLVTDSRARPVAGANVVFTFTNGVPAQAIPAEATTDAAGLASVELKLGSLAGPITGMAEVPVDAGIRPVQATFSATALPADADGIAMVSGNDQSGTINTALAAPLVVKVTDLAGNPIPGQAIVWTAETGGGTVSEGNTVTGADGQTSVIRILGSTAGEQTTSATAAGLAGSPVVFTHTATAGSAARVDKSSGDGQSGNPGEQLALPLVVQVLDGSNNPIPNRPVTWVIGEGGGSVSPPNTTTNAQGNASTNWTLGPAVGTNTVNAVVSGVGTATFTATATAGTPSGSTSDVSAAPGTIPVGGSSTITVTVRDASSNPVSGVSVTPASSGTGNTFTPAQASTGANGVATFSFSSTVAETKTITATAGGVAISDQATVTVQRVSSTVEITSDEPDPSTAGENVTVEFTVEGSGGTPTGDVVVTISNGEPSETCRATLTNGSGSCLLPVVKAGTGSINRRVITATYGGDTRFAEDTDIENHRVNPANNPPTAAFTAPSCTTGQACQFTDQSSDDGTIASWLWEFGDVTTSPSENPQHTYATPGSKSVKLTVTDDDGAQNSVTHDVTVSDPAPVNSPPVAGFTPPFCTVNVSCSFTDASTDADGNETITTWTWNFDDPADVTPGVGPNPSHTFTTEGPYDVILTVTDDRGASHSVANRVDVTLTPQGLRRR